MATGLNFTDRIFSAAVNEAAVNVLRDYHALPDLYGHLEDYYFLYAKIS
jgi:hypothetical protein